MLFFLLNVVDEQLYSNLVFALYDYTAQSADYLYCVSRAPVGASESVGANVCSFKNIERIRTNIFRVFPDRVLLARFP